MKIKLRERLTITVTEKDLHYMGSLTLGKMIWGATSFEEKEQVHVVNRTTGARFITYLIKGAKDYEVCLNGAAARLGEVGDEIIIMAYEIT